MDTTTTLADSELAAQYQAAADYLRREHFPRWASMLDDIDRAGVPWGNLTYGQRALIARRRLGRFESRRIGRATRRRIGGRRLRRRGGARSRARSPGRPSESDPPLAARAAA